MALIAEHLEAAGELRAAYGLAHARGRSSTDRDLDAARLSWERAAASPTPLPADDPDQLSNAHRPRTMLCATDYQDRAVQEGRGRLRSCGSCAARPGTRFHWPSASAGHQAPLRWACAWGRGWHPNRIGAAGVDRRSHLDHRVGDRSVRRLVGRRKSARSCGGRRPSSTWPTVTPPRAPASASSHRLGGRGGMARLARWWLGRPGWRPDLHDAVAMAEHSNHPTTFAGVVIWGYGWAIHFGVLPADDSAARDEGGRCRPPEGQATMSHWAWRSTRWLLRC